MKRVAWGVNRHPQCPNTAFEFLEQVLLVATIVGTEHDLAGCHLPVIGNVDDVPNVVEQNLLAFLDRQVLANHHHAVRRLARSGLVGKLRHVFRLQTDVLEPPLDDDSFLDVGRLCRLCGEPS